MTIIEYNEFMNSVGRRPMKCDRMPLWFDISEYFNETQRAYMKVQRYQAILQAWPEYKLHNNISEWCYMVTAQIWDIVRPGPNDMDLYEAWEEMGKPTKDDPEWQMVVAMINGR